MPLQAEDCARKFCAWLKDGYMSSHGDAFDVGGGTWTALREWQRAIDESKKGGVHVLDIAQIQKQVDSRLKTDNNSGNGSLMRCAPVALAFNVSDTVAMRISREQSDITHPSSVCGDACALYTALIIRSLRGENSDMVVHD